MRVSLFVGAAIVAVVMAGCGDDDGSGAVRPRVDTRGGPTIALFRRPQRAEDRLPRRFALGLARSPAGAAIDVRESRLAFSPNPRTRVFAMPGRGLVCVVSMQGPQGGGFGCGPASGLDEGYVFAFVRGPSDQKAQTVQAMGLLPDGVSTVTLVLPGGESVTTAVRNNAYYAVLETEPEKLIFSGPDGRQVTKLPTAGDPSQSG